MLLTSEDRIYVDDGLGPMMVFFSLFFFFGSLSLFGLPSSLYLAFMGGVTRRAGFTLLSTCFLVKCKAYIPLSVDKTNFSFFFL